MKIKLMAVIMTVVSLVTSTISVGATSETSKFKKVKDYKNEFTDVKKEEWYADSVAQAYEYGLVSGYDKTTYNPTGNVSIAETIVLACRLNNIYCENNEKFENGEVWYQPYVDYAIKNKIIDKAYTDYNASATRREFAKILSNSLPKDVFEAINNVTVIPDVDDGEDNIYMLYNAGILAGNDKYGTFNPTSNIQRSEVAAIIVRIADKTQRKEFKLEQKPVEVESVSLNKTSLSMTVGDKLSLTASVLPNNATEKDLVWKSSNTGIVSVTNDGMVTAISQGNATIMVSSSNGKISTCQVSVEKKQLTNTLVYEDSKVKINFLRVEKRKYDDDEVSVYFDAQNKTNETIKIQCDALSLNGYCFNNTIMSDDVSGNSIGTIDTILEKFDFSKVNIENIETVGGQFRIISDNKSFNSYDAPFINVDMYSGKKIKEYPIVSGKELLYSDNKLNLYFNYMENDDEDLEVYLTVQNKTNETITIQNDTVVVNGRSYDRTIMSDPVLAYTTGDVNVSVEDAAGNTANTIGGQFRIISDTKSFKSYDAVLGKTSGSNYEEDDYDDNSSYNSSDNSNDSSIVGTNDINDLVTYILANGKMKKGVPYIESTYNSGKTTMKVTIAYHEDKGILTFTCNGDVDESQSHIGFDYDVKSMTIKGNSLSFSFIASTAPPIVFMCKADIQSSRYTKSTKLNFEKNSTDIYPDDYNDYANTFTRAGFSSINLMLKEKVGMNLNDIGFDSY